MSDLPPDLPRLQIIRAWLAEQRARHEVVGIYLQVQMQQVEEAITAAEAQRRPAAGVEYRLQHIRGATGSSILHRAECWVEEGMAISRREALTALQDPQIKGGLRMCDVCRPENGLE